MYVQFPLLAIWNTCTVKTQGLFSGEIMRDLLIFMPKISWKFVKWEKKSHTKMKILQKFLLKFLAENSNFLTSFGWMSDFLSWYHGPELSLKPFLNYHSKIDKIWHESHLISLCMSKYCIKGLSVVFFFVIFWVVEKTGFTIVTLFKGSIMYWWRSCCMDHCLFLHHHFLHNWTDLFFHFTL